MDQQKNADNSLFRLTVAELFEEVLALEQDEIRKRHLAALNNLLRDLDAQNRRNGYPTQYEKDGREIKKFKKEEGHKMREEMNLTVMVLGRAWINNSKVTKTGIKKTTRENKIVLSARSYGWFGQASVTIEMHKETGRELVSLLDNWMLSSGDTTGVVNIVIKETDEEVLKLSGCLRVDAGYLNCVDKGSCGISLLDTKGIGIGIDLIPTTERRALIKFLSEATR
jgi:hypothetical protein